MNEGKNEEDKNKEVKKSLVEKDYYFPDYQLTIKATSRQEAEKKLPKKENKQ